MSLDSNDTSRLLDELSLSILRKASPSKRHNEKRLQDTFRRRVRRHNNARTNQFEVIERLDGLEEKFQILTLDNLSDALHHRRRELKDFEHQWLPDVLDFFLHLAGDPARNESLLRMYRVPPRIGTPPPLRWCDVLADDPIDRNDRLWRVPNFRDTDDSGYEDEEEDLISSLDASPSTKREKKTPGELEASRGKIMLPLQEVSDISETQGLQHLHYNRRISETMFIREILFLLKGFPSLILRNEGTRYELDKDAEVSGISPGILKPFTAQVAKIRQHLDIVRSWISERQESTYIEAMKDAVESLLKVYYSQLDELQDDILDPVPSMTASMIRVMHEIGKIGAAILTVADFLKDADGGEAIVYLEKLFAIMQLKYACNEHDAQKVLLEILVPSLNAYLKPCWNWVQCGELEDSFFFVRSEATTAKNSRLWHDRYVLNTRSASRPPAFMSNLAQRVLTCGKTASFLRQLSTPDELPPRTGDTDLLTRQIIEQAHTNPLLPFAEAFQNAFLENVSSLLETHTQRLKYLLNTHCGVNHTLDAIDQIFLGRNIIILGEIEPKIFDRIDRCIVGWNDRFEIRDMLETAFSADSSPYTIDAISIHSTYTSSRTMQNRRSSVKILSALAFTYRLSWPIANIIDEESMSIYRGMAMTLMQIRRARHSLIREGYPSVMSSPIDQGASPMEQNFAQVLSFQLLSFVDALYDCVTVSIMRPLCQRMRSEMEEALTLDDMIHAHKEYIKSLEYTCLIGPKLKVLRESLIAILDLCIRFADLVTNSAKTANGDSDAEAGSFTSALSRRRPPRGDDFESDVESDEAGLGDGYSSFIVLEDDTNIVKELRRLKLQYQRQLNFFVAGLRGVGKVGNHAQGLVILADRLTSIQCE